MGFINPKKEQEDGQLPGSGVEIDLETRVCPHCRREALPWEDRCPECGEVPVAPEDVPAQEVALPPGLAALAALEDEDRAVGDDDTAPPDEADTDGPDAHAR